MNTVVHDVCPGEDGDWWFKENHSSRKIQGDQNKPNYDIFATAK